MVILPGGIVPFLLLLMIFDLKPNHSDALSHHGLVLSSNINDLSGTADHRKSHWTGWRRYAFVESISLCGYTRHFFGS